MKSLTRENSRLGFIGIGNMGSRIARRLLEHGYQLMAYNRRREAAEALVKYGATVADSVAMLSSNANVILSCLTNDDAVKSIYTEPQGLFAYLQRGSAIIDLSTVLPETSRELYELSHAVGVQCLDSPISGSTPFAENGTLTLFCGGDEELFQAAQPIFSSIASQYFYLGGSGSGTAMKLVANTLLGVEMQATAEAVALGQTEGLDCQSIALDLSQAVVLKSQQ
jgi:3-hydroxyisobutyrate dehydrogenase